MAEHTLFVSAIRDKIGSAIPLCDFRLAPETSGVYCIANLKSGKCYIGSSIAMRSRLKYHCYSLRLGNHHSGLLQKSYGHHGIDAFVIVVLELVLPLGLLDCEQRWMDVTKCTDRKHGYNLNPRADRTFLSAETKRKMSEVRKGKRQSPEVIARRAAMLRGRRASEETRRRLSISHLGNRHTEESKRKIAAFFKGKSGPLHPCFGVQCPRSERGGRSRSGDAAQGEHRHGVGHRAHAGDDDLLEFGPTVGDAVDGEKRLGRGAGDSARCGGCVHGMSPWKRSDDVGELGLAATCR